MKMNLKRKVRRKESGSKRTEVRQGWVWMKNNGEQRGKEGDER